MAQIITAPNKEIALFPSVFLAGGITNCIDWQSEVIDGLIGENISIINPRQKHFDTTDNSNTRKQIEWEYERLEQMDIFSMYFCSGTSDQPICMYELGRNVLRMQTRYPNDWEKRIVISIEDGYSRSKDVVIQIGLCASKLFINTGATTDTHIHFIKRALRRI